MTERSDYEIDFSHKLCDEWEKLAAVSRNALVQDDYVSDSLYRQVLSILEKSRASN